MRRAVGSIFEARIFETTETRRHGGGVKGEGGCLNAKIARSAKGSGAAVSTVLLGLDEAAG